MGFRRGPLQSRGTVWSTGACVCRFEESHLDENALGVAYTWKLYGESAARWMFRLLRFLRRNVKFAGKNIPATLD